MGELLSIGEASSRVGVPTSTLRYWDRIGVVPAHSRSGGRRRYDLQAVQRVEAVLLCQRAGFTLEEISRLLDSDRPWQRLARRKLQELDERMSELQQTAALLQSALDCGCQHLESCGRAGHLLEIGMHSR